MKRTRRLLTSDRALPCDILHFARCIPVARAEVTMNLSTVAHFRAIVIPRVSWSAVFLKAYGLVSDRNEWLRDTYMRWPWPHLYCHQRTVARVAIQREHAGRPRLCWGRIFDPGQRDLRDIQRQLDAYTSQPVADVFRKQLRLSRLPWPLRRAAWWVTLNGSGRTRERQVGTFSMSSLAGQGVNNRDHPTLCTSSLAYGPLDRSGDALVTLIYDHRVMDGMHAAQTLRQLGEALEHELAAELRQLARRAA